MRMSTTIESDQEIGPLEARLIEQKTIDNVTKYAVAVTLRSFFAWETGLFRSVHHRREETETRYAWRDNSGFLSLISAEPKWTDSREEAQLLIEAALKHRQRPVTYCNVDY